MMKRLGLSLLMMLGAAAHAQTFATVPFVFAAGTVANASQVMTDFNSVINNGNAVATALNTQINALMALPSGSLVFYYLTVCPAGWSAVNATWNNLFVRGLDNSAGNDPDSANAIDYVESAGLQAHTHTGGSVAKSSNQTGINAPVGSTLASYAALGSETFNNVTTGPSGSVTQVPINVVLTLCKKN